MPVTPSDLLADLPDPRDDEPASLRSDIAEELTDHLVCSVRREMVKGADESTARERALKRFGDPRQIARKLWWLAMRRRIMNQRLMLGLQAAMFLAVIAVAAVMIQLSNAQQRQMARQQALLSAALAKLSERLDSEISGATAVNRVQVRVVEGTEGGPVVKTAKVTLAQPAWPKPLSPAVGKDGSLDFGYLDAGLYTLTTALDWGPTEERQFVVHPGRSHLEVVIAPAEPGAPIEVPVRIPLTEDLRSANVAIGLYPVMVATSGPFPNWKTWSGVKVFRTQTPDGRSVAPEPYQPTVALTNWDKNSLTGVMSVLPGTYGLFEIVVATKDESSIRRVTLTFDDDDPRRKVLTESGDEWRIELPEAVLKALPEALRHANSRPGEPLRIRVEPEQPGE